MTRPILGCLLAFAICVVERSAAQEPPTRNPLQPSDTTSLQATLHSFIDACNELYTLSETKQSSEDFRAKVLPAAERMKDCLDLSDLSSELRDTAGVESGVYLKEVLDRIELPPDAQIPSTAQTDTDTAVRWRIPGTRITLERLQQGPQKGEFVFTSETVRQAAKLYGVTKQLPYRSDGPQVSPGFFDRYVALTKRQPTLTTDTSSPRGTFMLFQSKANQIFELIKSSEFIDRTDPTNQAFTAPIYRCLDLSGLPEYSRDYYASEATVCIKEILDRVPIPPAEQIPGPEDVKSVSGTEPLSSWQIPNTKLTIVRATEGPQRGEYLFSSASVQQAVAMYEEVKRQPYRSDDTTVSAGLHDWYLSTPANPLLAKWVDTLPQSFRSRRFGMAVWQWLGLLIGAAISIGLMLLSYRIGGIRDEAIRQRSLLRYWGSMLFPIVAMLVPLAFKVFVWQYLTVRGSALYISEFTANTIFLIALIVVILGFGSRLADSFVAFPKTRSREIDPTLIRILFRLLAIIAATIVFLEGGRYLGFPLTTLLASAGIGGLAIAFSAQGMIRGLFGTVTILLDRPFREGDRIIVKGQDGFVEEVGLRSTKIREFLTGHLISIPNDQMADAEIKNIGKRKHIHRMTDLHIPIDTARDKVEKAVGAIRKVLDNHEGMDPDFPPRVYFNEFNPDSFNIRVIYWYAPPDLWRYYAMTERVNLEIFRVFDEHGIQFSLPIRHTFWKHDDQQGPLDIRMLGASENIE